MQHNAATVDDAVDNATKPTGSVKINNKKKVTAHSI
jgi:hypothetical protein